MNYTLEQSRPPEIVTRKRAAARLGMSIRTLDRLHQRREGPQRLYKSASRGSAYYLANELDDYLKNGAGHR